jgi:hypothetical protein
VPGVGRRPRGCRGCGAVYAFACGAVTWWRPAAGRVPCVEGGTLAEPPVSSHRFRLPSGVGGWGGGGPLCVLGCGVCCGWGMGRGTLLGPEGTPAARGCPGLAVGCVLCLWLGRGVWGVGLLLVVASAGLPAIPQQTLFVFGVCWFGGGCVSGGLVGV